MVAIFPAHAGFSVLWQEEDGKLFEGEPVIAWHLTNEGTVRAITPEGYVGEDSNWFGYLTPEGKVVQPDVQVFPSIKEANEESQKQKKSPAV